MKIHKQRVNGSQCKPNWCLQLNGCERIVEVIISHENVVNRIGFVIADAYGRTTTTSFGGGSGITSRIKLKNNEYITNISGMYGVYEYCGYDVITSLMIHTSSSPRGYGPYGEANFCTGVRGFSTQARRGSIVGFHGRCSQHLESIGLFVIRDFFITPNREE